MKAKPKPLAIIILLIVIGLLIWSGYNYYQQKQTAKISTGTIEVTKADITTKINGYMTELTVKEGDHVTQNQVIAKIDRKDLFATLTRDTAALAKAQADLTDLQKGARPEELREASANTAAMQSAYDKDTKDYTRYQSLANEGAIATQQLDNARAAYEASAANLKAAQEKEHLVFAGNRTDQIAASEYEVTRCAAVLQASQIALEDITIYSPLDGLILTKNFEPGEYVNAGTAIATVADMNDCWVKIYVPSADLGKIKIGESVEVMIDAFPDRIFTGHITEISDTAEYTPRQSITKSERTNMVFAVKVAVDNEEMILKPGMPADVIFND